MGLICGAEIVTVNVNDDAELEALLPDASEMCMAAAPSQAAGRRRSSAHVAEYLESSIQVSWMDGAAILARLEAYSWPVDRAVCQYHDSSRMIACGCHDAANHRGCRISHCAARILKNLEDSSRYAAVVGQVEPIDSARSSRLSDWRVG